VIGKNFLVFILKIRIKPSLNGKWINISRIVSKHFGRTPPRPKCRIHVWELDKGQRMHATQNFEISSHVLEKVVKPKEVPESPERR